MEECAVCLEDTLDRVKPCGHAVCNTCVNKWIVCNRCTCPLCRQPMIGEAEQTEDEEVVIIDPRAGTFFGVTLRNNPSGVGVLVTHTDPRDLVHASGIRTGVVITHINNIPVNEHQTAILLLETATTSETRIRLQTHTSPFTSVAQAIRTAVSRRFRRPRRSAVSTSVLS